MVESAVVCMELLREGGIVPHPQAPQAGGHAPGRDLPDGPERTARAVLDGEAVAERCIRLSTPEAGVCGACGAPWVREAGREARRSVDQRYRSPYDGSSGHTHGAGESILSKSVALRALGWRPSCGCGAGAVPAAVLDPFCGSGAVPAVAKRLGRRRLACDINPERARLAAERAAREACQLAFPF